MSTSYQWIYMIPAIVYVLFYLSALAVLMTKYNRQPQAAMMAMMGVGILLLAHLGSWVSVWFVGRFIDSDQFMLIHGLLQIVVSLGQLLGIGLILGAVFIGRRPTETGPWEASAQPAANDNPYAPPESR